MQQGDTQCVFLKNKSKVFSTWKEMVEIDTEYTYGNDCVRMLKNGMISCNILMGYVVNSLLARGFKVVEWKADKKPHLSVAWGGQMDTRNSETFWTVAFLPLI